MTTFLGQPMSQSWFDFPIWEEFFCQYPIKSFIELGTGNGGMSTFLALQCIHRGARFYTFDNQRFFDFEHGIPKILGLNTAHRWFDIFLEDGHRSVVELAQTCPKPLAIYFDNGDKPREWKVFAPLTQPGDFCIVHDWGMEFKQEDIGAVNVERILTDLCDKRPDGWQSMWFRRI